MVHNIIGELENMRRDHCKLNMEPLIPNPSKQSSHHWEAYTLQGIIEPIMKWGQ